MNMRGSDSDSRTQTRPVVCDRGDIMDKKPKGLEELLNEDPKLKQKISYEEYRNNLQNNGTGKSLKKAYEAYQNVMKGE